MSYTVEERLVKRWFAQRPSMSGGMITKSFGTKHAACMAVAREYLFDEVFGPMEEVEDEGGSYWSRPGVQEINDSIKGGDHREQFRKAFARAMYEFGFQCDETTTNYTNEPMFCCDDTFGFCGQKYKAWLKGKGKEVAFSIAPIPVPTRLDSSSTAAEYGPLTRTEEKGPVQEGGR